MKSIIFQCDQHHAWLFWTIPESISEGAQDSLFGGGLAQQSAAWQHSVEVSKSESQRARAMFDFQLVVNEFKC